MFLLQTQIPKHTPIFNTNAILDQSLRKYTLGILGEPIQFDKPAYILYKVTLHCFACISVTNGWAPCWHTKAQIMSMQHTRFIFQSSAFLTGLQFVFGFFFVFPVFCGGLVEPVICNVLEFVSIICTVFATFWNFDRSFARYLQCFWILSLPFASFLQRFGVWVYRFPWYLQHFRPSIV